jgi:hypothetical protein
MAFEILSIERIARKFQQEPNYLALIDYCGKKIECEFYTNALILYNGKIFCNRANFGKLNGSFYFRLGFVESLDKLHTSELEKEIIAYAKHNLKTNLKIMKTID